MTSLEKEPSLPISYFLSDLSGSVVNYVPLVPLDSSIPEQENN